MPAEKTNYTLVYPPGLAGKHVANSAGPGAAASKLANILRRNAGGRLGAVVVVVTDNRTKQKRYPYVVGFETRKTTPAERKLPRFKNSETITTAKVLSLSRSADGFRSAKEVLKKASQSARNTAHQFMGTGPGK
jgi:hypothetical protein